MIHTSRGDPTVGSTGASELFWNRRGSYVVDFHTACTNVIGTSGSITATTLIFRDRISKNIIVSSKILPPTMVAVCPTVRNGSARSFGYFPENSTSRDIVGRI